MNGPVIACNSNRALQSEVNGADDPATKAAFGSQTLGPVGRPIDLIPSLTEVTMVFPLWADEDWPASRSCHATRALQTIVATKSYAERRQSRRKRGALESGNLLLPRKNSVSVCRKANSRKNAGCGCRCAQAGATVSVTRVKWQGRLSHIVGKRSMSVPRSPVDKKFV